MKHRSVESSYEVWGGGEAPYNLECSTQVLASVRQAVSEAFQSLPRGGVEIGGILFGQRTGDSLRLEAWRPIPCRHSRGPGFELSEDDEAALSRLLGAAASDPELRGLNVVGWFRSRNRSEVYLSDSDIAFWDSCFPEPWQFALVLRPSYQKAMRAGIYFRHGAGDGQTLTSGFDFPLDQMTSGGRGAHSEAAGNETPNGSERTEANRRGPVIVAAPPGTAAAGAATGVAGSAGRRRSARWAMLLAAPLALALAAALAWLWPRVLPDRSIGLGLRFLDSGSVLSIQWERSAAGILGADRGVLSVIEPGVDLETNLDREILGKGSFSYARRGASVRVRLSLFQAGRLCAEESALFVGQPRPEPGPNPELKEVLAERDRLRREVAKQREALRRESLRTAELQAALKALRARLKLSEAGKKR